MVLSMGKDEFSSVAKLVSLVLWLRYLLFIPRSPNGLGMLVGFYFWHWVSLRICNQCTVTWNDFCHHSSDTGYLDISKSQLIWLLFCPQLFENRGRDHQQKYFPCLSTWLNLTHLSGSSFYMTTLEKPTLASHLWFRSSPLMVPFSSLFFSVRTQISIHGHCWFHWNLSV